MVALNSVAVCKIVLILFAVLPKSESIYCYYCNSANNSACTDINLYEEELRQRIIPIVHCERAIPSPVAVSFFCRKIVQTIYLSKRDWEVRVTRGCGWVRHHSECYRADNSDHMETVCQCFHDNCNSGAAPAASIAILVAAVMWQLLRRV